MKDSQREAILLDFIGRLQTYGSWCGETHIQKSTYFLQEFLEVPLDLNFIFYKHGPFSFDLNDKLTALRGNDLLVLRSQAPYGPHLHPSSSSATYLELFPTTRSQYSEAMDFIASRLARKNVSQLERLSTALYVRKEIPSASREDQAGRINALKPHVSISEAFDALAEVESMEQQKLEIELK